VAEAAALTHSGLEMKSHAELAEDNLRKHSIKTAVPPDEVLHNYLNLRHDAKLDLLLIPSIDFREVQTLMFTQPSAKAASLQMGLEEMEDNVDCDPNEAKDFTWGEKASFFAMFFSSMA
jgi:hypothetical protein